jgi:hypothetical protein
VNICPVQIELIPFHQKIRPLKFLLCGIRAKFIG